MSTTTNKNPARKPNPEVTVRVSSHEMGCYPRCKCMCDGAFCACREGRPVITEPSAEHRAKGARVGVNR